MKLRSLTINTQPMQPKFNIVFFLLWLTQHFYCNNNQGYPTTFFSTLTVRRSKYYLKISKAQSNAKKLSA